MKPEALRSCVRHRRRTDGAACRRSCSDGKRSRTDQSPAELARAANRRQRQVRADKKIITGMSHPQRAVQDSMHGHVMFKCLPSSNLRAALATANTLDWRPLCTRASALREAATVARPRLTRQRAQRLRTAVSRVDTNCHICDGNVIGVAARQRSRLLEGTLLPPLTLFLELPVLPEQKGALTAQPRTQRARSPGMSAPTCLSRPQCRMPRPLARPTPR